MCVDHPGGHLSEDFVDPEGSMGHDDGGGGGGGGRGLRRSIFFRGT